MLITKKRLLQKALFGNPNMVITQIEVDKELHTGCVERFYYLEQFGMIPGLSKLVSIITSPCPAIIVDRNKTVKRRKKIFWRYHFVMIRS